jgi:hypothetical protein
LNKKSAQNKKRIVTTASRKPLFHPKTPTKNKKLQTHKTPNKTLDTRPKKPGVLNIMRHPCKALRRRQNEIHFVVPVFPLVKSALLSGNSLDKKQLFKREQLTFCAFSARI